MLLIALKAILDFFLLPFFCGLRKVSSALSSPTRRFAGLIDTDDVVLIVVDGKPKSRSGRDSASESEFSTTSWPLETTRLLAPEFAETCDAVGGWA